MSHRAATEGIMAGAERQLPQLMDALKLRLKARGLRQRDVAERMGVGLATVKRWLAGDGLTAERLEELCDLAQISLFDLIELAGQAGTEKATRFTPFQEQALGRSPQLFFIFFSLLNGWPPEDCRRELRMTEDAMDEQLKKLARLGLIDLLPGGRLRILTAREVAWRPGGPLAKYFEIRKSFVDMNAGGALYSSDFVKLTDAGLAQVRYLIGEFRREVHRIAKSDRHDDGTHSWQGLLFFMRPLDMDAIRASMATEG
jgi:transcriptional regulator with XRE-family HTH domain